MDHLDLLEGPRTGLLPSDYGCWSFPETESGISAYHGGFHPIEALSEDRRDGAGEEQGNSNRKGGG